MVCLPVKPASRGTESQIAWPPAGARRWRRTATPTRPRRDSGVAAAAGRSQPRPRADDPAPVLAGWALGGGFGSARALCLPVHNVATAAPAECRTRGCAYARGCAYVLGSSYLSTAA